MFFKRQRRSTHAGTDRRAAVRARSALLAGASVLCACGSHLPPELGEIPSGLRVGLETRFYDVPGLSAHDLEVAMVMHGPEVEAHPRYAATAFQIGWSFSVREAAGGCVVQAPRIELRMVEHLPHWTDRDRAHERLRVSWDTFFAAVRTHERGHQRLSVDGARRMLRALRDIHSAGGCADLRDAADRAMQELLTQVHTDNHRYDLETNGGARAGVRWPPPR